MIYLSTKSIAASLAIVQKCSSIKSELFFVIFLKYLEFSLNLSLFGKKIIKLLVEEILRCLIIFNTF